MQSNKVSHASLNLKPHINHTNIDSNPPIVNTADGKAVGEEGGRDTAGKQQPSGLTPLHVS